VFNPCDGDDDSKTVTAILYDNKEKLIDFGANALTKYAEIIDDGQTAMLFQGYKMNLLHLDKEVESLDGRRMGLMKLISDTLRFIGKKALFKLKDQIGKVMKPRIRWVLTVPALWSEEHKNFMRKAAVEAGIIGQSDSADLLLCLEPEGASIQCREDSDRAVKEGMKKGSVLMVLDCGGGTVDITVHKVLCHPNERYLCKELLPSSGGSDWGSKYVDLYFEDFLKEFLGQELFAEYKKSGVSRLDMLHDFEVLKKKFKGDGSDKCTIKLSSLGEILSKPKLTELVELYNRNQSETSKLRLKGTSSLELPNDLVASFFVPLLQNIKAKLSQLIEVAEGKNERVDFMFLVGGFSESLFLRNVIMKSFEPKGIHILAPKRPQISVIRGACMYGMNPRFISSRIAKMTYGINTLTTFNADKHPREKRVYIEGDAFCEDIFDPFVRKGDTVSPDEVHTKIYCPVRTKQTIMRIIFYVSENRHVEFIDEKGASKLGELCIDIGALTDSVENKTVKLSISFGDTHIIAIATNKIGTEIKKCEFKFESMS
jgi:hypothetical protein